MTGSGRCGRPGSDPLTGPAVTLLPMQQVQRVGGVVDVVDGGVVAGPDRQAEQGSRPRRRPGAVEPPDRDLRAERGHLDQVPVAAVDGQDVAVGGDDQTEGAVKVPAPGDGEADPGTERAE